LKAIGDLSTALKFNKNALLTSGDNLSDLLFVPCRVADVLGRIGSLLLLSDPDQGMLLELERLCHELLSLYGNSILSVAEDQAAPYFVFLSGCLKHRWIDIAEEVVGRLVSDLIANFGRVARAPLDADEAITLLRSRYKQPFEFDGNIYQSPSDLSTVVLLFSAFFDLDEVIDQSLILLDHTALNFFVPDDLAQLGAVGPVAGRNMTFILGHGIWRCIDLRREWAGTLRSLFLEQLTLKSSGLLGAVVHASLAFKDRVPWHALAEMRPLTAEPFCRVSTTPQ
jgi:hypothetical protein